VLATNHPGSFACVTPHFFPRFIAPKSTPPYYSIPVRDEESLSFALTRLVVPIFTNFQVVQLAAYRTT
jgi:hypothetical protein